PGLLHRRTTPITTTTAATSWRAAWSRGFDRTSWSWRNSWRRTSSLSIRLNRTRWRISTSRRACPPPLPNPRGVDDVNAFPRGMGVSPVLNSGVLHGRGARATFVLLLLISLQGCAHSRAAAPQTIAFDSEWRFNQGDPK